MPAERYFIEQSLSPNACCELKGPEFHHLAHVMRTQRGDVVEIVNGQGALALATLHEIKKDKALLIVNEMKQTPPSPCRLVLAQAFPKPNRLDFILEKGTELGVDSFWLFPGHHSVKKECYPSQLERARTITIAAMKQCGRLYLPSIDLLPPIEKWQQELKGKAAFFGDINPEAPLFEKTWDHLEKILLPVIFIIGPEGGLSKAEEESLNRQGAKGVKLHGNILRTETASLMALSLLSHWLSGGNSDSSSNTTPL